MRIKVNEEKAGENFLVRSQEENSYKPIILENQTRDTETLQVFWLHAIAGSQHGHQERYLITDTRVFSPTRGEAMIPSQILIWF